MHGGDSNGTFQTGKLRQFDFEYSKPVLRFCLLVDAAQMMKKEYEWPSLALRLLRNGDNQNKIAKEENYQVLIKALGPQRIVAKINGVRRRSRVCRGRRLAPAGAQNVD